MSGYLTLSEFCSSLSKQETDYTNLYIAGFRKYEGSDFFYTGVFDEEWNAIRLDTAQVDTTVAKLLELLRPHLLKHSDSVVLFGGGSSARPIVISERRTRLIVKQSEMSLAETDFNPENK